MPGVVINEILFKMTALTGNLFTPTSFSLCSYLGTFDINPTILLNVFKIIYFQFKHKNTQTTLRYLKSQEKTNANFNTKG